MPRIKHQTSSPASLTVDDVAREAGVSRTAVSYVLNEGGQRNKHVSEETRTKVLRAIQSLNYHSHAVARALKKGYSEEVALLLDATLPPVAELISSVRQQALVYGYTPVMYLSQGLSPAEREVLHEMIFARRPIGIIAGPFTLTSGDVTRARQMGVQHIIFIEFRADQDEHTHTIVFPSRALGYLAAHHLLERGHRHLAIIQPDNQRQEDAFLQRLEGMHAAMADAPGSTLDVLPLHLSVPAARALVEATFTRSDRPTGIYAFNDEFAIALLGALAQRGIRVPQEVAIIGTDNLPMGEFVWPPLTSMCFDALDIGMRAITMLHTLHLGLPLSEELARPLVPQLIPRGST